MTAPGTSGRPASTSRRKGRALNRGLFLYGAATQAGLVLVLLLMAALAGDDRRLRYGMLWSIMVPVGVMLAFGSALQRLERNAGGAEAERREVRRAFGILAAVGLVWLAGLAAVVALA